MLVQPLRSTKSIKLQNFLLLLTNPFLVGKQQNAVKKEPSIIMIKFFALCGAPQAGKSKVQKLLGQQYGITAIDDKRGLRDAAKILYGLSEDDVSTQSGKSRIVTVGDKDMTVREVLGKLGEYLEKNDPLHFARMARRQAEENHPGQAVSFGSVRMQQGQLFQDKESLVIEVLRPGIEPKNAFDKYDKSLVHVTLINDFDPQDRAASSRRLEAEIIEKLTPFLGKNWLATPVSLTE